VKERTHLKRKGRGIVAEGAEKRASQRRRDDICVSKPCLFRRWQWLIDYRRKYLSPREVKKNREILAWTSWRNPRLLMDTKIFYPQIRPLAVYKINMLYARDGYSS
jgi:hypothetical protein